MNKKTEQVLLEMELFTGMDAVAVESLFKSLHTKVHHYKKNEYVCIAGDPYYGIGIVLSGEVTVIKENAAGTRTFMTKLTSGDIFGEMIAFADVLVWPATVQAVDNVQIIFISRDEIKKNRKENIPAYNQFLINLLKMLSQRGLLINRKVEYLILKSMREKIAAFLLEQYRQKQSHTFMIPMNRNELADFLNVSRPSMSREMAKMKNEQIIDYYKATFKILDMERLKESIK